MDTDAMETGNSHGEASAQTVDGNDAVCFTASFRSAIFGAGTIHAYLAAKRKCPKVVAGISMGALSAAAMQRTYREQHDASPTTPTNNKGSRWVWFRKYIEALSNHPLDALWDAIPDQSDFFADMIPIRDTSLPEEQQADENEARRRLYLLVKLGHWLVRLPLQVSLVTRALVNYVRMRENYTVCQRIQSAFILAWQCLHLLLLTVWHICSSPTFFPVHQFHMADGEPGNPLKAGFLKRIVPWLNLFTITLTIVFVSILAVIAYSNVLPDNLTDALHQASGPLAGLFAVVLFATLTTPLRSWLMDRSFSQKHILPIARGLFKIFGVINAACVCTAAICAGWLLFHNKHNAGYDGWLDIFIFDLFFLILLCILFAPAVYLPEVRRQFVKDRLLQQWPRPILGWGLYLFMWIHLISFAAFLPLGAAIFPSLRHDNFKNLIRDILMVLAIPVFPLILSVIPVFIWNRAKQFASAQTGFKRWLGLNASRLLLGVLLLLGSCLCSFELHLFHKSAGSRLNTSIFWMPFCISSCCLALTWLFILAVIFQPILRRQLFSKLMDKVGLSESIAHDFHLCRRLIALFGEKHLRKRAAQSADPASKKETGPDQELLQDDPMPALIVAAPLQTLFKNHKPYVDQVWANPGTPLIRALSAALAIPPVLAPARFKNEELRWWYQDSLLRERENTELKYGLDLVDGSAIRQNPLPALFGYLREKQQRVKDMSSNSNEQFPAIHVVFGVPIKERTDQEDDSKRRREESLSNDIVDVGLASYRLSARRDTQFEVLQTNFISRIESFLPPPNRKEAMRTYPLFADEIAPESDLTFDNPLNPQPDEVLKGVREGCRRTLEVLYSREIAKCGNNSPVKCAELFATLGIKLSSTNSDKIAGLPELCEQCTSELNPPVQADADAGSTASIQKMVDHSAIVKAHPQLSGKEPRIAFIASGGVFRGSFHIGMLAALRSCNIKPDLIVGASVGTLMGGALGASFANGDDVLRKLVHYFIHVDDSVALTLTLKNAARELGLRGRAIRLSPNMVRRMVMRGSRSDPGYAAAGAPTALIDAISDLFMIPYEQTKLIAALMVAGKVTNAIHQFLFQLEEETIRRLGIEKAMIDTSLLERVVVDLFCNNDPDFRLQRQPFQGSKIAFFGMTTNLNTHSAVLLGADGGHASEAYDFIEASLASSAFPAVFAPRAESQIFPGVGRTDVFFSDGGMFDNLPFLPAVEILCNAQKGYRQTEGSGRTVLDFLNDRLEKPDLLIAGALDPVPEEEISAPFKTLSSIQRRADSLHQNNKIRALELSSQRVYSQLQRFKQASPEEGRKTGMHIIDEVVNAAVLPVYPTSRDHLNGTFAFCASMGLKKARVQKSIADGCFQTLNAFVREQRKANDSDPQELDHASSFLATKSVNALTDLHRIPRLELSDGSSHKDEACPYYRQNGSDLNCPFAVKGKDPEDEEMRGIHRICIKDRKHKPGIKASATISSPKSRGVDSARQNDSENKVSPEGPSSGQIRKPSRQ